jgi:hypothetical protein
MTREARSDFGSPTSVRNAGSRSRLATGTPPSATPARRLAKRELELRDSGGTMLTHCGVE